MPNSRKTTNQEEIKMRKLIVEAPELKEGQSDSSGGIRENGKMSVQYKNPVPYVGLRYHQQFHRKHIRKKTDSKNRQKTLYLM